MLEKQTHDFRPPGGPMLLFESQKKQFYGKTLNCNDQNGIRSLLDVRSWWRFPIYPTPTHFPKSLHSGYLGVLLVQERLAPFRELLVTLKGIYYYSVRHRDSSTHCESQLPRSE